MIKRNLEVNKECIIRDRPCGRVFSGSNTCFVACPASNELGFEIEITKSVLLDEEIEPYIAVEHFEPAREIFCTKICTKIIESKFCIVLLSGVTNKDGIVLPNPNVYYEYGLMTAWSKYIIPIQRIDQKLAFNIQSLDTIKYTPSNFKSSLSQAVRLTVASIEDSDDKEHTSRIDDFIPLYFELKGLSSPRKKAWTTEKTNYIPFASFNFATIVYTAAEIDRVYYETKVIIRRLERYISDLDHKINGIKKSYEKANTDAQKEGTLNQQIKMERQKVVAMKPKFVIITLQPELKNTVLEQVKITDTSLTPEITVISYDEMKRDIFRA